MSNSKEIEYSDKYEDSQYEYRHVILPKEIAKQLPQGKNMRLLTETEWRSLGVQQSRGWAHYELHRPEVRNNKSYTLRTLQRISLRSSGSPCVALRCGPGSLITPLCVSLPSCPLCSLQPHVLLFRRPLGTDPITGKVVAPPQPLQQQQQMQMQQQPAMKKVLAK